MFNDKQNKALTYEIESSRIKSRSKGNVNLSYLEGFDILETANKIFGFGNWTYSVTKLEQVSQELNQNQNHTICYKAVIKVTIHDAHHSKQVSREDVGFGTGIAKTLAEAHEGGAKEAVTDAIKRAMRSFGNQFGNSLYNKSRNHSHQQRQPYSQEPQLTKQRVQNTTSQEYINLHNIGLTVVEKGQKLIVMGNDIFSKKDSIKACGFRWDGNSKFWYKPIEQQAA